MNNSLSEVRSKLAAGTGHFKDELNKIRTGRAHPAMLDGIMVEVYGQQMPLKAVAGITAPEAQLLQVSPFDPSNLQAIVEAIRNSSMGFNPADDGRIIRIQVPPLTEETRQQMVKVLNQKTEEALIGARQVRHDAMRKGDQAEKDKSLSRDEKLRFEKQLDEQLAAQKTELENLAKAKESEIMTI